MTLPPLIGWGRGLFIRSYQGPSLYAALALEKNECAEVEREEENMWEGCEER